MANTTLTQTGAEVQSAINKAEKLPTVTGSDEGKTLQVDSSGNFVANTVSSGGNGFTLTINADGFGSSILYALKNTGEYMTITSNTTITNVIAVGCLNSTLALQSGAVLNLNGAYSLDSILIYNDSFNQEGIDPTPHWWVLLTNCVVGISGGSND